MTLNDKNYDYLIVGAGPFGSIFAYEAAKRGKRSLIIEKRPHIAGNMYTHTEHGIRFTTSVHTSSTLITRKFGTTSVNSLNLTDTKTKLWQTTRVRCTTCHST